MRRAALACSLAAAAALLAWRAWPRGAVPRPATHGDVAIGAREDLVRAMAQAPRAVPPPEPEPTGTAFDLRVVTADGTPVPDARVELVDRDTRRAVGVAQSNANGVAEVLVPEADAEVELAAIARAPNGDEGATSDLSASEPLVEVGPLGTLRGVVVDARGEPVPDARIDPRGQRDWRDGELTPDGVFLGALGSASVAVAADADDLDALLHTAADGTFVVPMRGPDVVDVVAVADGMSAHASEMVQLLPGTEAFVRVVLGRGGVIAGRVLGADGAPLENATVSAVVDDAVTDVLVEDDGSFRIEGIDAGTDVRVEAAAPGFLSHGFDAFPHDAPDTVVRLERGASVDVHACLRDVDATHAYLRLSHGLGVTSVPSRVGADGCAAFHVDGLEGGTTYASVVAAHFAAPLGALELVPDRTERVDVSLPRRPMRIDLPPGVTSAYASFVLDGETIAGDALPLVVDLAVGGRAVVVADGLDASGHEVGARQVLGAGGAYASLAFTRDPDAPVHPVEHALRTLREPAPPPPAQMCEPTSIYEDDDAVLVDTTTEPAPQRLYAGDRVLAIDGVRTEAGFGTYPSLYGPCGEPVRVRVLRPATGRIVDVTLDR